MSDKINLSTRGRPLLNWTNKKPLNMIKGFPAQLIEIFNLDVNSGPIPDLNYEKNQINWRNLLLHGDNKDVLSTMLEQGYRDSIKLIYIDPPFSSKKDYVRKVKLRGISDHTFEHDDSGLVQQLMYEDMWKKDEYFQFIYERLLLLRELLNEDGTIWVHLDETMGHYVKVIMDEVFGSDCFINQIIWYYPDNFQGWINKYSSNHNFILVYGKKPKTSINRIKIKLDAPTQRDIRVWDKELGRVVAARDDNGKILYKEYTEKNEDDVWEINSDELEIIDSVWSIGQSSVTKTKSKEYLGFVTQKPEELLKRIIESGSDEGDIILDCFLGSGTTIRVAEKLNRKWIGCDINKGSIQMTSRELQKIIKNKSSPETKITPFSIFKINDYDLTLLNIEAKNLVINFLGIEETKVDSFFDGEMRGGLVKIIDFSHPFTPLDYALITEEIQNRTNEDRGITVVCLGKELSVDPLIEEWNQKHVINKIQVIDLRMDQTYGAFLIHEPLDAEITAKEIDNEIHIKILNFISPTVIKRFNLHDKLFKKTISDFRSMIDYVLIDNNYDGLVFNIVYSDIPENRDEVIVGDYVIESDGEKSKIAIKIVDVLGEEYLEILDVE